MIESEGIFELAEETGYRLCYSSSSDWVGRTRVFSAHWDANDTNRLFLCSQSGQLKEFYLQKRKKPELLITRNESMDSEAASSVGTKDDISVDNSKSVDMEDTDIIGEDTNNYDQSGASGKKVTMFGAEDDGKSSSSEALHESYVYDVLFRKHTLASETASELEKRVKLHWDKMLTIPERPDELLFLLGTSNSVMYSALPGEDYPAEPYIAGTTRRSIPGFLYGTPVMQVVSHKSRITSMAVSGTGQVLATGDENGRLKLLMLRLLDDLSVSRRTSLRRKKHSKTTNFVPMLSDYSISHQAHQGPIYSMVWLPCSTEMLHLHCYSLVTGSADRAVRTWRVTCSTRDGLRIAPMLLLNTISARVLSLSTFGVPIAPTVSPFSADSISRSGSSVDSSMNFSTASFLTTTTSNDIYSSIATDKLRKQQEQDNKPIYSYLYLCGGTDLGTIHIWRLNCAGMMQLMTVDPTGPAYLENRLHWEVLEDEDSDGNDGGFDDEVSLLDDDSFVPRARSVVTFKTDYSSNTKKSAKSSRTTKTKFSNVSHYTNATSATSASKKSIPILEKSLAAEVFGGKDSDGFLRDDGTYLHSLLQSSESPVIHIAITIARKPETDDDSEESGIFSVNERSPEELLENNGELLGSVLDQPQSSRGNILKPGKILDYEEDLLIAASDTSGVVRLHSIDKCKQEDGKNSSNFTVVHTDQLILNLPEEVPKRLRSQGRLSSMQSLASFNARDAKEVADIRQRMNLFHQMGLFDSYQGPPEGGLEMNMTQYLNKPFILIGEQIYQTPIIACTFQPSAVNILSPLYESRLLVCTADKRMQLYNSVELLEKLSTAMTPKIEIPLDPEDNFQHYKFKADTIDTTDTSDVHTFDSRRDIKNNEEKCEQFTRNPVSSSRFSSRTSPIEGHRMGSNKLTICTEDASTQGTSFTPPSSFLGRSPRSRDLSRGVSFRENLEEPSARSQHQSTIHSTTQKRASSAHTLVDSDEDFAPRTVRPAPTPMAQSPGGQDLTRLQILTQKSESRPPQQAALEKATTPLSKSVSQVKSPAPNLSTRSRQGMDNKNFKSDSKVRKASEKMDLAGITHSKANFVDLDDDELRHYTNYSDQDKDLLEIREVVYTNSLASPTLHHAQVMINHVYFKRL